MRRLIVSFLFILALLLFGCSVEQQPAVKPTPNGDVSSVDSCSLDSDCVCGGVDTTTGMCFMGNKDYYEKNVDKSKQCPDFCTGIAGNLVMRCIDNKCIQMFECLSDADCAGGTCKGNRCSAAVAECSADSDCSKQGCSGQLCAPSTNERRMTTCEYREEYGCLKLTSCGCDSGKCGWRQNQEYADCLKEAKAAPVVRSRS